MLSIVIPALNEQEYIGQCLESLRNQDYQGSYEVIVVDNGSTDRTRAIAEGHGAKVVSCAQRGVIPARETGARVARGDVVVQADADTTYPRHWLSRLADNFARHPRAVAVGGRFVYHDPPWWARLEYGLRTVLNLISLFFYRKPCFISGANFAFRKDAFVMAGGYDPASLSADQFGLANRLSRAGRIIWDRKLTVPTSARRVRKPFHIVLGEGLTNSHRIITHAMSVMGTNIMEAMVGRPAARNLARSVPILIVAAFVSYGYFVPGSQVFGKVYYQNKALANTVSLTFDDGPNEPYTSQVLDILARYNIKATFFLIGANVEHYPEVARRIAAEGHVIGNHTYSHDANHALNGASAQEDIRRAQETIRLVVGVTPRLYRPPEGKKSPWELSFLKQENLIGVTWSISANEATATTPEQLARQITNRERHGRIIVLHDGYRTVHNRKEADKGLTVQALPLIIENLLADGYSFVTVPQLFNVPSYN